MRCNKEKQAAVPQKVLHELFDYNPTIGRLVWIKKTSPKANSIKIGQPAGSLRKDGYVSLNVNGYTYLVHRLVWTYVHGDYPDGEQPFIDHINGKRNDNRIENLKCSSNAENGRNQSMKASNTSGITGICRMNNGYMNNLLWYWRAQWNDENGTPHRKDFSICKLGEDQAKQMAINHRAEQIRLLEENHGIVYSDRHGI